MKKEDKIRLLMLFLSFIAGASIVCLLFAFGVVHAQEGCGEWQYRWVKQECMRSLDLSGIENAVWRPPDTCWQQERYWVPGSCPEEKNWWDPPLDTISIDTTYKIWENIRHSGGAFSLFLKETRVLPMKIKEGTIDSIVWESKCRRGDSTWQWNPETKKWEFLK